MQNDLSTKSRRWTTDWRFLALLAALSGFAYLAWLIDWALEGAGGRLDRQIYLAFRHAEDQSRLIGPDWLTESARDITALGSYPILTLLTLAVVAGLCVVGRGREGVFTLIAIALGAVLSSLLKHLFDRARPDLAPHAAEVFTSSFPSAHAMLSTIVYLTLAAVICRSASARALHILAILIAASVIVLVGVSRVHLGVHWPSDVLAGWAAGGAWALAIWVIADRFIVRGQGASS